MIRVTNATVDFVGEFQVGFKIEFSRETFSTYYSGGKVGPAKDRRMWRFGPIPNGIAQIVLNNIRRKSRVSEDRLHERLIRNE